MTAEHDGSNTTYFWCDLPEKQRLKMAEHPESIRHWYLSLYSDPQNRETLLPGFTSSLVVSVFVVAAEVAECEYVGLTCLFESCRSRGFLFREVANALRELEAREAVALFRSQSGTVFVAFKRLRTLLPTMNVTEAVASAALELEAYDAVAETECTAPAAWMN